MRFHRNYVIERRSEKNYYFDSPKDRSPLKQLIQTTLTGADLTTVKTLIFCLNNDKENRREKKKTKKIDIKVYIPYHSDTHDTHDRRKL